ncbi:MAG: hypothetical protein EZS28_009321, partial [Streblomastix strix]
VDKNKVVQDHCDKVVNQYAAVVNQLVPLIIKYAAVVRQSATVVKLVRECRKPVCGSYQSSGTRKSINGSCCRT